MYGGIADISRDEGTQKDRYHVFSGDLERLRAVRFRGNSFSIGGYLDAADPDDDRILECALAGNADLVVSRDGHLTQLETFQGIGIARPVDLLRILGE